MPGNGLMLIFKLLKMFLSSLNWLEFEFIQALEHPKSSSLHLANGMKRDIKLLALLSTTEQYFYSLNAKLCRRTCLIISW